VTKATSRSAAEGNDKTVASAARECARSRKCQFVDKTVASTTTTAAAEGNDKTVASVASSSCIGSIIKSVGNPRQLRSKCEDIDWQPNKRLCKRKQLAFHLVGAGVPRPVVVLFSLCCCCCCCCIQCQNATAFSKTGLRCIDGASERLDEVQGSGRDGCDV